MEYDPMSLKPGQRYLALEEIRVILKKAEDMGLPLQAGSWMEQLTFTQIDLLTRGVYDA